MIREGWAHLSYDGSNDTRNQKTHSPGEGEGGVSIFLSGLRGYRPKGWQCTDARNIV